MIRALAIVGSVAVGVVVLTAGCALLALLQWASDEHLDEQPRPEPRADHWARTTWNDREIES